MKTGSALKKNGILVTKGLRNQKKARLLFVLIVLTPSFISYIFFKLYPNILSVYYSFLEWDGLSKPLFVGLRNFRDILKDTMLWKALYNNLLLFLFVPAAVVFLSILLADMLISRNFRENNLYKVVYFFPNVLSGTIIGIAWIFIYDGRYGLINGLLELLGIEMNDFYWLGDQRTALLAVGVVMIWSTVGFYVVIFMNAMSGIPESLYESAILDGITHFQKLFKITIPLIMGVLRVAVIFLMLNTIKGFNLILVMTRGGPGGKTDVLGLYMYRYVLAIQENGAVTIVTNYGYASAIGMVLFAILIILKLVADKFFLKESVEY